jgi:hypothetical protein
VHNRAIDAGPRSTVGSRGRSFSSPTTIANASWSLRCTLREHDEGSGGDDSDYLSKGTPARSVPPDPGDASERGAHKEDHLVAARGLRRARNPGWSGDTRFRRTDTRAHQQGPRFSRAPSVAEARARATQSGLTWQALRPRCGDPPSDICVVYSSGPERGRKRGGRLDFAHAVAQSGREEREACHGRANGTARGH